jgi:group I intron endonuclease
MYKIYKIVMLAKNDIVYIGSTKRPLRRRLKEHRGHPSSPARNYLKNFPITAMDIVPIDYAENKTDALRKEIFWTKFFIERGYTLFNRDIGKTPCQETRKLLSNANKGRKLKKPRSKEWREKQRMANLGKKHSLETRRKMSATRTGKKHSEETKEKIRLGNIGKVFSDEARKKMSIAQRKKRLSTEKKEIFCKKLGVRPVICLDTGEEFFCIKEAARRTGARSETISRCCHGQLKTAGKLHWAFKEV